MLGRHACSMLPRQLSRTTREYVMFSKNCTTEYKSQPHTSTTGNPKTQRYSACTYSTLICKFSRIQCAGHTPCPACAPQIQSVLFTTPTLLGQGMNDVECCLMQACCITLVSCPCVDQCRYLPAPEAAENALVVPSQAVAAQF